MITVKYGYRHHALPILFLYSSWRSEMRDLRDERNERFERFERFERIYRTA